MECHSGQRRALLRHAQNHVFERVSVARDHELLTEALRHGRGHIRIDELKGRMATQESAGQLLRHGDEVATSRELTARARHDRGCESGPRLFRSAGQRTEVRCGGHSPPRAEEAVEFVLDSRDRAVAVSGAAGAGKTATLKELRRGLAEAGRDVVAVAPTMSAVAELQAVGFTEAMSVERLLQDSRSQSGLKDSVIIVDEAGMVSGRQMAALLGLARTERRPHRLQRGHSPDPER